MPINTGPSTGMFGQMPGGMAAQLANRRKPLLPGGKKPPAKSDTIKPVTRPDIEMQRPVNPATIMNPSPMGQGTITRPPSGNNLGGDVITAPTFMNRPMGGPMSNIGGPTRGQTMSMGASDAMPGRSRLSPYFTPGAAPAWLPGTDQMNNPFANSDIHREIAGKNFEATYNRLRGLGLGPYAGQTTGQLFY